VRLYRATKNNPPTDEDMMSYWDLGRRPPRTEDDPRYEQDKAAYEEVSTFVTAEEAAAKAKARASETTSPNWRCQTMLP
jgi:hypothetical protein